MAKMATVITDLFEDIEFTSPRDVLVEAGHEVITIGPEAGHTAKGKKGEAEVTIDKGIDEVKSSDYRCFTNSWWIFSRQIKKKRSYR